MLRLKSWVALVGIISVVCVSCACAGSLVMKRCEFRKGPHTPIQTKTALTLPFNDTCEGAFPGKWVPYDANASGTNLPTNPYFGPTTQKPYAGTKSYYCSQSGPHRVAAPGPYPSNFTGWITYGPFSLAGMTSGRVRFKLWNNSGAGDVVFAGWSLDDQSYEGFSWSGNSSGWIAAEADMSGYSNTYLGQSSVYFSFHFQSDATANAAEGAYIDNISVTAEAAPAVTGGLAGTIKSNTGTVLKGAVVTAGTAFTYTDALGKYSLNLPAGTYAVKAQKPGYAFAPVSASVTVASAMITKNFTGTPCTGDGVVKYWAVSVGINQYKYVGPNLSFCVNDATDTTAALKAGGFPAANIRQLTDAQATKAAIKSAIAWMATQADADDVCVFFQSSHGDQGPDVPPLDEAATGNNDEYICTYDCSTKATEIRDDELGQWMAAFKTTKYVVLIDTCYAGGLIKSVGPAFGSGFARAINGMSAPGRVQSKDLDDLGSGVVIASCTDTQESEETAALQNGVFAYYLVQGMNNGKADANKDGWYAAEEVYNYSKGPVSIANPSQTLMIYDGYPGQLKFAKAKAAAPATALALAVSGTAAATTAGTSAITVNLSAAASVSATICNLAGRPIAMLAPQDLSAGVSTLLWSGKSALGTQVPAGMYLVKLQAHDASGKLANCLMSLRK